MTVLIFCVVALPFLLLLILRGDWFKNYAWGFGALLLIVWVIDWHQSYQSPSLLGRVPTPLGDSLVLFETFGYVAALVLRLCVWAISRLCSFLKEYANFE